MLILWMERGKDSEVKWFTQEQNPEPHAQVGYPNQEELLSNGSGMSDTNIKGFQNRDIITLRKCSPDKEIVLLWTNSR